MRAEVDKSLAGHRRRVGDIEADLKLRLRQIAAELAKEQSQNADVDVRQELEDLQCRYDMAVDDVHQLKQENQQLQEQLAAGSQDATTPPIMGDDWQAQKSRLLAELDAEEQGSMDTERRREVAAIEATIAQTDQLIAQKDQEIANLQAALAREPESQPQSEPAALTEALKKEIREEIFAEDQLIQQERERLEAMQQEWQEKLREAELEISMERAKLAREHLALQEKLSRQSAAQADVEEGKPRRRWLSALGLGEDEEEG